jgi:hypothetical protein
MDTCGQTWAPVKGRRDYRIRLHIPELPLSQGDFKVYAFLTDEKALHLHDMRVLDPGFTVVAPDYTVGITRPRHDWRLLAQPREADVAAGAASVSSSGSS